MPEPVDLRHDPPEGESSVVQYNGSWLARVHEDGCVYAHLWETEEAAVAWNAWLQDDTTDLNDEQSMLRYMQGELRSCIWDSNLGCYRRQYKSMDELIHQMTEITRAA